jgi:hypothetical protein
MNTINQPISRRTLLRGLGTAVTLPLFESLVPRGAFGQDTASLGKKAVAAQVVPRRVAWLYVPNGIHMPAWTPEATGKDFELTPTLMPLAPYRDKLTVITGLMDAHANANGDGAGDHARAQASYLTGAQPFKTGGANIHLGVSADQAGAQKIGHLTKLPSLEIGIEGGAATGSCDSGYSCAYSHNLAWRSATTPVAKDINPQSVFDRLFANGNPNETAEARARRENDRKSVLDYVMEDASSLQKNLATADRQKLDEYLTSVREIEQRLARTALEPVAPLPAGAVRPATAKPREYPDHAKLMMDMMVLAFQTDLTRIVTFPLADEGSSKNYPWADADVPHHPTSHHMGDPAKQALLQKINTFHIQQLAYLCSKLDSIKEANGLTILDNTLIGYGSGNSDGNRHNHDNLPFILMGKGGRSVTSGRHILVDNVPITNVWLTMLDSIGANIPSIGDSTGRLSLS